MENNFRFASSSVSDRGLSEKRPVNEDSFLELGDLGLFAVADGVGGAQAGDFASQMAMETLSEAFHNLPPNFDAEQALKIAIQHANQSIFTMSSELPQLASMATTLAALHVDGNIATIAHVGDSRVYRILPDGTLQRETADHSVVEEEVRAGRMTPEQALVHPSRNVISRALGAEETVDVDIKTIMVEPGTMFLLCSDGITRHIEDPELESIFGEEIEPQVLCEQMKEICYSRGAEDNLTAVVVRISGHLAGAVAPAQVTPQPENVAEVHEDEEETVATARSPFDEPIVEIPPQEIVEAPAEEIDESPTHGEIEDSANDSLDDEGYLLEEHLSAESATEEPEEEISTSVTVPAEPAVATSAKAAIEPSPFSYSYQDDTPSSRWGGLFTSALLLLLGGAIGFAALWFWQQANPAPQVPVLSDTKGSNITMVVFEETRRLVDEDPPRFLLANTHTADSAEDRYFLGRALLLTGKHVEATNQFRQARDLLPKAEPVNAKILANEIALGEAIANNPTVADAFAKSIANPNASQGVGENLNVNRAVNVNSPLR